jgi:hypothetical protein
MNNVEVKQILAERKIPKSTIAELAGIFPSELSAYFRSRDFVSQIKAAAIEQAVDDVLFAQSVADGIQSHTGLPISLNLRDTASLQKFIERGRDTLGLVTTLFAVSKMS